MELPECGYAQILTGNPSDSASIVQISKNYLKGIILCAISIQDFFAVSAYISSLIDVQNCPDVYRMSTVCLPDA